MWISKWNLETSFESLSFSLSTTDFHFPLGKLHFFFPLKQVTHPSCQKQLSSRRPMFSWKKELFFQRPLPFINHTINNSECRATGYRKQEKAGSLDALWVTVIAWTSQTKLPSAPACREARFWMDQPFPRAGDGALIHTGWNHFVLFPGLLLSGKMGGAKTERTKIIFHISSWSSEYWIIWEIFLGLFQIILRRQAFSENGHSAFGLIFWRPSVIDLLES